MNATFIKVLSGSRDFIVAFASLAGNSSNWFCWQKSASDCMILPLVRNAGGNNVLLQHTMQML